LLPKLQELADHGSFVSLRELNMGFRPLASTDRHFVDQAMAHFISALPPLESLSLYGLTSELTLDAVLTHGWTLKVPFLESFVLASHHSQLLPKHCPHTQNLSMDMSRSGGTGEEIQTYLTIGSLRSLQRLL
jgi:hypothetical protein